MDVKEAIRAIRFSKADIARVAGISAHTLDSYIKGARTPRDSTLDKLINLVRGRASMLLEIASTLEAARYGTVRLGAERYGAATPGAPEEVSVLAHATVPLALDDFVGVASVGEGRHLDEGNGTSSPERQEGQGETSADVPFPFDSEV